MKNLILFLLISVSLFADTQQSHEKLAKETKEYLLVIKSKIIRYRLKNGKFPKSLKELKVKKTDSWGRELIFKLNKDRFNRYELYSLGKDGVKSKDDIHLK